MRRTCIRLGIGSVDFFNEYWIPSLLISVELSDSGSTAVRMAFERRRIGIIKYNICILTHRVTEPFRENSLF